MMHDKRRFSVANIDSAEILAEKLTEYTWCVCNGFRLGGYLFLNDSTGGDGVQEYAIVRESDGIQVESITFGWCDRTTTKNYIDQILAGKYNHPYSKVLNRIEAPSEHGQCSACA